MEAIGYLTSSTYGGHGALTSSTYGGHGVSGHETYSWRPKDKDFLAFALW